MILFLQFLFCLVVAALIAGGFYWYGRDDGVQIGKHYSETRYETGKRDGYTEGYIQMQKASYEAGKSDGYAAGHAESSKGAYESGYKDGWAYRQRRMGGGS